MSLLVIEGVDGAGKSTQLRLLNEYFSLRGHSCEYLHFPRTDAPYFGELITRFLKGEFGSLKEVDPYLVALLYAGDRKDASEMIMKWMEQRKTILLDRYTYSNIAYQCAKIEDPASRNRLLQWILNLEFEHFAIPRPDLNIFLDVPFAFTENKLNGQRSGEDRAYLNGSKDIHEENLEFQKKVRDIFRLVAESDSRLAVVNCSDDAGNMLSPREIFELIIGILKTRKLI